MTRLYHRSRAAVALVLVLGLAGSCARPHAGPKTLAALGTLLLAGGGTTWVAGERKDNSTATTAGMVTTLLGAGLVVAAGGWMASSIACEEDPDCPRGEECKEVPAPPGGVPYRQCVPRPGK